MGSKLDDFFNAASGKLDTVQAAAAQKAQADEVEAARRQAMAQRLEKQARRELGGVLDALEILPPDMASRVFQINREMDIFGHGYEIEIAYRKPAATGAFLGYSRDALTLKISENEETGAIEYGIAGQKQSVGDAAALRRALGEWAVGVAPERLDELDAGATRQNPALSEFLKAASDKGAARRQDKEAQELAAADALACHQARVQRLERHAAEELGDVLDVLRNLPRDAQGEAIRVKQETDVFGHYCDIEVRHSRHSSVFGRAPSGFVEDVLTLRIGINEETNEIEYGALGSKLTGDATELRRALGEWVAGYMPGRVAEIEQALSALEGAAGSELKRDVTVMSAKIPFKSKGSRLNS